MPHEPIRTLFSRQHDTVFPRLGVFLAGPTPADGQMANGWRRIVTEQSSRKHELVAPEFIEAITQALVGEEWKY